MNFDGAVPVVKTGLGVEKNRFAGGRIGAALAWHGGIADIEYFGRQQLGHQQFFTADIASTWIKLFRVYVVIDGKMYYPGFTQTRLYPFGYSSRGRIGKVVFQHELILLDDALVQRIKVLRNPGSSAIQLKLLFHEFTKVTKPTRQWNAFVFDREQNALMARATDRNTGGRKPIVTVGRIHNFGRYDTPVSTTYLAVSSEHRLKYRAAHGGFKHYLETVKMTKGDASFFVLFGHEPRSFKSRLHDLRRKVYLESDCSFKAYTEQLERQPQISYGQKTTQSALMNVPSMSDALKVPDVAGGIRASDSGYWIWGWDSMVYADAYLLWGDRKFVREMLFFFKALAHRRMGIPHQITMQLNPRLAMAFPAQCLYIIMLYYYHLFTGDLSVLKRFYPFAKWILRENAEREIKNTGMIEGHALLPDFPKYLGEDSHDLSAFNNSIYYQALRAMEYLAATMGDMVYASEIKAGAERCRIGFNRFLFDRRAGTYVDSVSSRTLKQRRHYTVHPVLWVTPFAAELVSGRIREIALFMKRNFRQKYGLYEVPTWDSAFMGDGNQVGAYMPVTDVFYYNLMRLADDKAVLNDWSRVVAWYWNQQTIPEGLTYEAENEGITPDSPGCKQLFSGKSWYSLFFSAMAGFETDAGGLTFSAGGGPLKIGPIRIRQYRVAFSVSGQGRFIDRVVVNGRRLTGTNKVAFSMLKPNNIISIIRTAQRLEELRVLRANGISVRIDRSSDHVLAGRLIAIQSGEVWVSASRKPVVTLNGSRIDCAYRPRERLCSFWVENPGHFQFEVHC